MSGSVDHIIVCDDENYLREMVGEYLCEKGYRVTEAANAATLHQIMAVDPANLIILDVNMPGQDGLTALRMLRNTSDVPVIMLTAAVEVIDRVVGLEMGADDYVGKPVDLRELAARAKAALRRSPNSVGESTLPTATHAAGTVPFGQCQLDLTGARLIGPDGNELPMTAMEYSLLRVFYENRGRTLNRDQLLQQAHERGWEPFDRSIDLRISRLRRKIEANPGKPETIRTVRGVGYVFR